MLKRDGEPDVIEVDEIPFAAMTPVIVTHRFFGRSIADLVMDIQRIKTALLRALLDNAYLANNPRTEVPESHATETTLDDLLVSRPGGIVRTKLPGGLSVIAHPDVGGHVFPLLQYQDATREWRTGVSRQGQGVDPNVLQNQVATIANQMFNAAQAKMKMIARIFAETGIRDLFALLHAVVRKHGSQPQTARLRNQWITVDLRDWKARNDMTINVGLGTGTKTEQLAHLNMVIGAQEKAIAAGLVSPKNLYNSAGSSPSSRATRTSACSSRRRARHPIRMTRRRPRSSLRPIRRRRRRNSASSSRKPRPPPMGSSARRSIRPTSR